MDTLSKVLNLVKPGHWAISFDMSDAYLHVSFFLETQKISPVLCKQNMLPIQRIVLRSNLPRVFTKLHLVAVHVVATHLRQRNVSLASHLDNWLALNQERRFLVQDQ